MNKFWNLIKNEAVFFISAAAATASAFFVPSSEKYAGYIDFSMIILLFCLMAVVSGFKRIGLFSYFSRRLLLKFRSGRAVTLLLTGLCFFSAMLLTNDVALLTFVPLTLGVMPPSERRTIGTVIAETVAANLGSMATPVGNPQNLYLFSHYSLSLPRFFGTVLPYAALGLLMAGAYAFLISGPKNTDPDTKCLSEAEAKKPPAPRTAVYSVLFALCVLSVLDILSCYLCLAAVAAAFVLTDPKALLHVDYFLLLTFACFFIFVGNVSDIGAVKTFVSGALEGREIAVSALFSQFISNVPAAVMLSGFTGDAHALLLGTNIGGLGTPVASLASLISYKLYTRAENARKGAYMKNFLVVNFAMLALLLAVSTLF